MFFINEFLNISFPLFIILLLLAITSCIHSSIFLSTYFSVGKMLLKFCFQSGACPSITTPEKVTLVPHWIVNNVPK